MLDFTPLKTISNPSKYRRIFKTGSILINLKIDLILGGVAFIISRTNGKPDKESTMK
jgi:hypothetical protein